MSELYFGYCMCSAKLRKDYTRALKKILYKKILSTRTISVLFSIFASKWTLHTYKTKKSNQTKSPTLIITLSVKAVTSACRRKANCKIITSITDETQLPRMWI